MRNDHVESLPPAYTEGFLKQDYTKVLGTLQEDPSQARLVFSELQTTLLHAAAYDGQNGIVEHLIALGANVNAREISGRTPLHFAVNNGHLDVVNTLLLHGAALEAEDNQGMTPLMWAKISRAGNKTKMVARLLEMGAKDNK